MGAIGTIERGPATVSLSEEPCALVFLKADGPKHCMNINLASSD